MTDFWAMRRSGELKITSIKGWAHPPCSMSRSLQRDNSAHTAIARQC